MTNACDFCQRELPDNDGGLCGWCIQNIDDERNQEWWASE